VPAINKLNIKRPAIQWITLSLIGTLLLASCELPNPDPSPPVIAPPPITPIDTTPIPNPPTVNLGTITSTSSSVNLSFTATASSGSSLDRCEVTLGDKKQSLTLDGVSSAVRNLNFEALVPDTAYIAKVDCVVKSPTGKENNFSISGNIKTLKADPIPPKGEGGTKNGFADDFNPQKDYYYIDLEQVKPDGSRENLRYIRGIFPLKDVLPTGQEYFLSTTTTNPSNSITGSIDTRTLNQGQQYTLIARVPNGQPNGGKVVAEYKFVPDNIGSQIPDIQPNKGQSGNGYLSQLSSALTSQYGNWVGGGARVGSFDALASQFFIRLVNTRSLEDNPVPNPNGVGNPANNTAKFAAGIKFVRYYALAVDNTFVNNLEEALKGQSNKPLLLAQLSTNDLSGNPTLNNYPTTIQTLQGDSKQVASLAQLGDGGSTKRYVLYAVAYDRLGNPSLNTTISDAYYNVKGYPFVIINVDNTPPTVETPKIVDRGPLDVHARDESCNRIDIAQNPNLAPIDIFVAEEGWVSGCALISAAVSDSGVGFDSAKVVNTLGNLVSIGAPSSGFLSNQSRLGLKITARGSASLGSTVLNMNDLSGLQTFTLANVSDMLGNIAGEKKATISVDNEEPTNLILSIASQNSSNLFTAWQQVGLASSATDEISGLRKAGDVAPISLFYGTDRAPASFLDILQNTLPNLWANIPPAPLNNTLIQIAPSSFASFNLPFPGVQQSNSAQGGSDFWGNLNIWIMAVDRAGNASAEKQSLQVHQNADITQWQAKRYPLIREDLGQLEVGNPLYPYQGLTTLNYNAGGVVPLNARDELNAGPKKLNANILDYNPLPSPGSNKTSLYRVFIPQDDIVAAGEPSLKAGLGKVGLLYRISDPLMGVSEAAPFAEVNQINPALFWPNSTVADQSTARLGSFRYNLPSWSSRIENQKQVGHIWNTIVDLESGPYNADFSAAYASSLAIGPCGSVLAQCASAIQNTTIAGMVINNYGLFNIQSKR
jgi:hypothetical protein